MADHLRKQIRAAAVTALTGLATSAGRVYDSKYYPMQDADLPGLRVYANDQAIEQETIMANPLEASVLQLEVECCAKANTSAEDTLDQMAKEVQVALAGVQTMAGARYVYLRSMEAERAGEGEKALGVLRLTFEVLFKSAQNAPDVAT
jgi:transaldolase